ncbi:LIM domain-containing protein [Phanerochaete sordida]|uniref:LIM domain-containing protein n=1 Tax=Phanerochaete sordida TaxID=48140 RepID=A0A9P3GH15_9APHY|nr:LIM domain-containing protein [Phanerochaete sordida]
MSPPSVVTPNSANSTFTLSSFPAPPHTQPYNHGANGASNPNFQARDASPARRALPNANGYQSDNWGAGPSISVSGPSANDIPRISVGGMDDDDMAIPSISIGGPESAQPQVPQISVSGSGPMANGMPRRANHPMHPLPAVRNPGGLFCGACGGAILGRSINTMGANWHPGCFRCAACDQLLENLAMFEHEGKLYCSLDYYEQFAPRCYHCQTVIADQDYISLAETDGLGTRTYHTQHFFCAECGDPFLPPSGEARSFAGDGTFDGGEGEGFTVYNGHPYCERCHVRLRMPKCKKCKKPIRKDMDALEVLGGKWCPDCFVCKACEGPFTNGRFFLRDEKPFCQHCFEIIIKSEL